MSRQQLVQDLNAKRKAFEDYSNLYSSLSSPSHMKASLQILYKEFCDAGKALKNFDTTQQAKVVQPQAKVVQPQAKVVQPQAKVVQPQAKVVQPQAKVVQPQAKVVQPQAKVVSQQGYMTGVQKVGQPHAPTLRRQKAKEVRFRSYDSVQVLPSDREGSGKTDYHVARNVDKTYVNVGPAFSEMSYGHTLGHSHGGYPPIVSSNHHYQSVGYAPVMTIQPQVVASQSGMYRVVPPVPPMAAQSYSSLYSQPQPQQSNVSNSVPSGISMGGQQLDATCIWFHKVTGEQRLFPKGYNPGAEYSSPYINPR
jgi:hypothetical protein